jgi:hypothetical protein
MTRVLVIGPYPPSSDPLAVVTLDHVRALVAEGDDVEVMSPEPSAARWHGSLTTASGLAALARAARGRDRVVVQLRSDLFAVPARRSTQAVVREMLRFALRDVARIEIVPHGAGAATSRGAELLAGAGAVVVEEPPEPDDRTSAREPDQWPPADGPDGIAAVQAAVRSRAAAVRARRDESSAPRSGAPTPARGLEPIRLAIPVSSRAVTLVRRLLHRLTAWETEPIVARLNRLSALAREPGSEREPG